MVDPVLYEYLFSSNYSIFYREVLFSFFSSSSFFIDIFCIPRRSSIRTTIRRWNFPWFIFSASKNCNLFGSVKHKFGTSCRAQRRIVSSACFRGHSSHLKYSPHLRGWSRVERSLRRAASLKFKETSLSLGV